MQGNFNEPASEEKTRNSISTPTTSEKNVLANYEYGLKFA
jgi:hypothetical protein